MCIHIICCTHYKTVSSEFLNINNYLSNWLYDIFAAPHIPFPEFLTSTSVSIQPQQGVIDMDPAQAQQLPQSLSVELPVSCGPVFQNIIPAPLSLPQVPQTSIIYEGSNLAPPRTI